MNHMDNRKAIIGILSLQHAGVDFLCALAVYSRYISPSVHPLNIYLIYNFCAFALQMPLGVIADRMTDKAGLNKLYPALIITCLGIIFTIFGCYTYLWLLGLGNALFHVGGGMITIREDNSLSAKGRGLGTFVAPGALGLFAGTILGKQGSLYPGIAVMVILLLLSILLMWIIRTNPLSFTSKPMHSRVILITCLCFSVVVLRSYVGLAMSWPWKNTLMMAFLAVCAVASGKTAGGFLSASLGTKKTVCISLVSAAVCFLLGNYSVFGILGLFFFNMTMPITLYTLKKAMPDLPGLAFGILTFALFIGILPYVSASIPVPDARLLGSAGSLISLVLLLIPVRVMKD